MMRDTHFNAQQQSPRLSLSFADLIAASIDKRRRDAKSIVQVRAPLAACAAMSDRIAPRLAFGRRSGFMRSIMMNPIGASAIIRPKIRGRETATVIVEIRKRRRIQPQGKEAGPGNKTEVRGARP